MTTLLTPSPAHLAARGPARLHATAPKPASGHYVTVIVRECRWSVFWVLEATIDGVTSCTRSGEVTIPAGYTTGATRLELAAAPISAQVGPLLAAIADTAGDLPVTVALTTPALRRELETPLPAKNITFAAKAEITLREPSYDGATDTMNALLQAAQATVIGGTFTVATDASVRRKTPGAGVAWVSADGRCGNSVLDLNSSLAAEIGAYVLAVQAHAGRIEHLHILTDSRHGMDTAARALQTRSAVHRVRDVSTQLRQLLQAASPAMRVTFEHVRGHDGHDLNTAADRLAVLARRADDAGVGDELHAQMQHRVIADLLNTCP